MMTREVKERTAEILDRLRDDAIAVRKAANEIESDGPLRFDMCLLADVLNGCVGDLRTALEGKHALEALRELAVV